MNSENRPPAVSPFPLRLSKQSGFGRLAPQVCDVSPVVIGTASSCTLRLDAALHPQVAPHHAKLAWNGERWYLLDGGSPAGTWISGRRVAEAVPVEGTLEFALGRDGPRLLVEVLAPASFPASEADPEKTMAYSPNQAHGAAMLDGHKPGRHASPASRMLPALVAVLVVALAVMAYWIWQVLQKGSAEPQSSATGEWAEMVPQDEGQWLLPEVGPATQPSSEMEPWGVENTPSSVQAAGTSGGGAFGGADILVYEGLDGQLWVGGNPQDKPPPADASVLEMLPQQPGISPFLSDAGNLLHSLAAGANSQALSSLGLRNEMEVRRLMEELWGPAAPSALLASRVNRRAVPASKTPDAASLRQISRDKLARAMPFSTRSAAPKVWCVSIGIDDYENISDLVGCRNDAAAVAWLLLSRGLLRLEQMAVLTDDKPGARKATAANIFSTLRQVLQAAEPQDLVVVYFSGHGLHDPASGETFFTAADFDENRPVETSLLGSDLQALVQASRAGKIFMIFDACHSGGLGAIGRTARSRSLRESVDNKFLDQLAQSTGHIVARAATKDEYSIAEPRLGHSVFTFVLLKGLAGDADRDRDGIVSLSELRPFVTRETPKLAAALGHEPFHPSFTAGGQIGESGDIPLTMVPSPTNSTLPQRP